MNDPQRAYRYIIEPTLAGLADRYDRPPLGSGLAARLLVAIGLQESELTHTKQLRQDGRPREDLARGWWQFEPGEAAALAGILRHPSTLWARSEIAHMGYPLKWRELWWAVAYDQRLAAVLARALLWTDPRPLQDDENAAWALYTRTWRPGKPRHEKWGENWGRASEIVGAPGKPAVPFSPPSAPIVEPPQSAAFVFTRMRGATKLYWTGGVGWPPGSAHSPTWDERRSEARTFKSRAEAAAMIELWPALHGTQGHEVAIEPEEWGE